MSLAVSAGAVRPPPWRLMPLLFDSSPPTLTVVKISWPTTRSTISTIRPSLSSSLSPGLHVARQGLVVEADAFLVAQFAVLAPLGVEDELVAVVQEDLAFFKLADADLRTLHVGHDGHFAAALGGGAAHQGGAVDMVLRLAVRKIQAHDVDAGADHLDEDIEVGRSRADGCDDLGATVHERVLVKNTKRSRQAALGSAFMLQTARCVAAGSRLPAGSCLPGIRGRRRRRSRYSRSCR